MRFVSLLFFILIQKENFGQVVFYNIPAQTIYPYKALNYKPNPSYQNEINVDSIFFYVPPFEISRQITYKEYKKYLIAIKSDSSESFYKKQLPCFYDAESGLLQQYHSSDIFDGRPVVGISFEAATQYCKWKTMKDFGESSDYQYKMTDVNKWLAAWHYLDSARITNEFNQAFSDWTNGLYFEGSYGTGWAFAASMQYEETDPLRLKRRRTVGNSFLRNYENVFQSLHHYEYGFNGSREISFRIIKERKSKQH